jgi:hypothetical protein
MIRLPGSKILVAGVLLLAMGAASCGGDDGGGEDPTARPIDDSLLGTMAVYEVDLPGDFAGFVRVEGSGFKNNEQSAEGHFDPVDEAGDLERFAQEREYVRRYGPAENGSATQRQSISFVSSVRLFIDATGAGGYLEDELADLEGGVGKEVEGAIVNTVERVDIGGIGDEAAGMRSSMTLEDGGLVHETQVFFRRGRLLITLTALRTDEVDYKPELEALARSLDERIDIVLEEAPAASPAAVSPSEATSPAAEVSPTPAP